MLRLRSGIILLGLWLLLVYNIERLGVNIASFVYVLVPVAIGILLLAPRLFFGPRIIFLIVPVLLLYFSLKFLLGYPLVGAGLPITVMEISSIAVSLLLARQLTFLVMDFEDTITKLTFQIGAAAC
jgi:hypothetical protein